MPRSLVKSIGKKPFRAEILAFYDKGLMTLVVSTQLLIFYMGSAIEKRASRAWQDS